MKTKVNTFVQIRAWTSDDGWWLGSDERLKSRRTFKRYGILAKLYFLYCKLFYNRVVLEIVEHDWKDDDDE